MKANFFSDKKEKEKDVRGKGKREQAMASSSETVDRKYVLVRNSNRCDGGDPADLERSRKRMMRTHEHRERKREERRNSFDTQISC